MAAEHKPEPLIEGKSIHAYVTEHIISELEAGVNPWVKPWNTDAAVQAPLNARFTPYGFYNAILLGMVGRSRGYRSRIWMTENRARSFGGRVRLDEIPTPIRSMFRFSIQKQGAGSKGPAPTSAAVPGSTGWGGDSVWGCGTRIWMVYNCCQIEGLPAKFLSEGCRLVPRDGGDWIPNKKKFAECRRFFDAAGGHVVDGDGEAYFSWNTDNIGIPPAYSFDTEESYWATLAHEYIHWTGHHSRLNRPFTRKRTQKEYAREELVAEIGSAFLCQLLGITSEIREDHAAYIECWLQVLKQDSRAVLKAATAAQQAVDFLVDAAGCTFLPCPGRAKTLAGETSVETAVVGEQRDFFAGGQLVLGL